MNGFSCRMTGWICSTEFEVPEDQLDTYRKSPTGKGPIVKRDVPGILAQVAQPFLARDEFVPLRFVNILWSWRYPNRVNGLKVVNAVTRKMGNREVDLYGYHFEI